MTASVLRHSALIVRAHNATNTQPSSLSLSRSEASALFPPVRRTAARNGVVDTRGLYAWSGIFNTEVPAPVGMYHHDRILRSSWVHPHYLCCLQAELCRPRVATSNVFGDAHTDMRAWILILGNQENIIPSTHRAHFGPSLLLRIITSYHSCGDLRKRTDTVDNLQRGLPLRL